jgi:hypothetical protein
MTESNFRALCAELVNELHDYKVANEQHDDALVNRARAALAQPEPEGVSDKEILRCAQKHSVAYTFVGGEVIYGVVEGYDIRDDVLKYARDLLARWGRPAIEPVPVSERLPGPEDCDAEGRCWWWIVDQPGELPHWIYCQLEVLSWTNFTAWLPHWALPVPGVEGE